jgi:hypothetical protein
MFPEEAEYGDEPKSVCQVVEQLGMSSASGQARLIVTEDVLAALWSFFCTASAMYGEKGAAVLLLRLVSRDLSFEPPEWMRDLFRLHRDSLHEAFARDVGHNRDDDFAEGA